MIWGYPHFRKPLYNMMIFAGNPTGWKNIFKCVSVLHKWSFFGNRSHPTLNFQRALVMFLPNVYDVQWRGTWQEPLVNTSQGQRLLTTNRGARGHMVQFGPVGVFKKHGLPSLLTCVWIPTVMMPWQSLTVPVAIFGPKSFEWRQFETPRWSCIAPWGEENGGGWTERYWKYSWKLMNIDILDGGVCFYSISLPNINQLSQRTRASLCCGRSSLCKSTRVANGRTSGCTVKDSENGWTWWKPSLGNFMGIWWSFIGI